MVDREQLEDGVAAMLDGNRVRFGEIVADLLAQKAAEQVDALRDEMAQTAFNFDDEDDGVTEVSDEEIEEEDTNTEEG